MEYLVSASIVMILLIVIVTIFRMIAYISKATVQASIGDIPLAMGLSSGNIIFSAAILSIVITAPIGSILIEVLHKNLLVKTPK